MREQMKRFFREWCNDWLSVKAMAEYHDISETDCQAFIDAGRDYHEADCDAARVVPLADESRRSAHI